MRISDWSSDVCSSDLWSPAFMVGGQVTGKRFGIIGMGRVGQVAAKRARGLDMAVHYPNRRRLDAAAGEPLGATHHATIEDRPERRRVGKEGGRKVRYGGRTCP